jgi:hypothetical protein
VIPRLAHHPNDDRARAGRVGQDRAADTGEEDRQEHVGVAEPAADVADDLGGEPDEDVGDPPPGHELGGKNEERHGHEREAVDAAEHPLRREQRRQRALNEEGRETRAAHGQRHRHAEEQGHEEHAAEHQGHRRASLDGRHAAGDRFVVLGHDPPGERQMGDHQRGADRDRQVDETEGGAEDGRALPPGEGGVARAKVRDRGEEQDRDPQRLGQGSTSTATWLPARKAWPPPR